MTITAQALFIGTALALSALAAAQVASQPRAIKLDSVAVVAARGSIEPNVAILDSGVVSATRADVLTAQLEEATRQADAATRKGS